MRKKVIATVDGRTISNEPLEIMAFSPHDDDEAIEWAKAQMEERLGKEALEGAKYQVVEY